MAATGGHPDSDVEIEDESSESDFVISEHESSDSDIGEVAAVDFLPAAQPAAIARKRSFARSGKSSQSKDAKRARVSGGTSTAAPRRSTHDRIKQFPDEYLSESSGKLYCTACNLTISIKHSIVKAHVSSQRHLLGKERKKQAKLHQQAITASWKKFSSESASDLAGSGLSQAVPEDVIVRRANVVEAFLKAGIPLSKVDYLRPLLEAGYGRLTYSTHMAQLIPFLLSKEVDELRKEISGAAHVAVVFDGSSRLGEALAVILRYVDADFRIHQRLVCFHVLAKNLAGLELSRELIAVLSTQFQLSPETVLAVVRDSAAVNGVAVRSMQELLYPNAIDVKCVSHSLDNVGKRFEVPLVDEFAQWWVSLFSHSPAARLAWKQRTGKAPKTYSATRWWSRWEVLQEVLQCFGDVQPFLEELSCSPSARQHLLDILTDNHQAVPNSNEVFRMELAAAIDGGRPFVMTTYTLEGDGPLVLTVYDRLQEIIASTTDIHFPNIMAVAKSIAPNNQARQQELITAAEQCVQPALNYFRLRFSHQDGDLRYLVEIYKGARLGNPSFVRDTNPAMASVDNLRELPFLNRDETIDSLKVELPVYKAACANLPPGDIDTLSWWRRQQNLPNWKLAVQKILHITPSSASVERVFSLLKASTTSQQENLLEDQLQLALMLQYNRGRLSHEV